MRFAFIFLLTAFLGAPAFADHQGTHKVAPPPSERPAYNGQEPGVYRFGATYNVLRGTTASACQSACGGDKSCQAWSYVAMIGDAAARCELKRGGGKVSHQVGAVSGISMRHEAKFAPARPVLRTTSTTTLSGGPTSAGKVIRSGPAVISAPNRTTTTNTTTTTTRTVRYPNRVTQPAQGRVSVPLNRAPVSSNTTVTYEAAPNKTYYPDAKGDNGGKSTSYYPERSRIVRGETPE